MSVTRKTFDALYDRGGLPAVRLEQITPDLVSGPQDIERRLKALEKLAAEAVEQTARHWKADTLEDC